MNRDACTGCRISRVFGQVVTEVGFLGAGVIMAGDGTIIGVTFAAMIRMLAAAGSFIGLNRFGTAVDNSVFTVCVLVGVQRFEDTVGALGKGFHRKPVHE